MQGNRIFSLVDRRQILKGAVAGALASTALPFGRAFAEEPKKGGVLRIGLGGGQTTNNLDTASGTWGSPAERVINYTLFNGLVEIGPDGQAIPELAESWDVAPGAKEWIFNIRKGVTFHNGKTMTADDVVYSLKRHTGPDTKSGAAGQLKEIESIEKVDDYKVRIVHATGNADLHYIMSNFLLTIVPAGEPVTGIGTGPYVLENYEPGVRCNAKRNENYWKAGRGHVDAVQITIVNDDAARLAALQAGEVDVINRLDPKTVGLMSRMPGIKVINSPGNSYYTINMRCDRAPFDNLDLRLAMKYAIDREQMLDRLLRGFGKLGNDHPVPSTMPFFNASLEQRKRDLDKAKEHFAKSGHSGPIDIHTSTAAFSGAIDMAVLLQAQVAEAGIELNIIREPQDGYWENIWRSADLMISYWTGRAVPDQIFTTAYYSKAPWNDTHWSNGKFDELMLGARVELDQDKRAAMYGEAQSILRDDGGALIPLFFDALDGARDTVSGDLTAPNMELAGGRIAERCWLS